MRWNQALRNSPEAQVRWPTKEEQELYADLFEMKVRAPGERGAAVGAMSARQQRARWRWL